MSSRSSKLSPTLPNHAPLSPSFHPSSLHSPRSIPTSPILVQPLPSTSALAAESLLSSEAEYHRQIAQRQREKDLAEALQEQQWSIEREAVRDNMGSWSSLRKTKNKASDSKTVTSTGFAHPPQAYELYQAIDRKDIDFIMRVRDHAFNLLLQKNSGQFPILYAARIGPGHRDIVILLIGAMSRYVNQLDESQYGEKETKNTLKALRANLKLAIDNALLPGDSPHLLSSYLQVLIMSEGDTWVLKAVYEISLLLRDPDSKPVAAAEEMVRRFCTKELRGVSGGVGDVEEYIANAALDLVIMATWSLVAGQIDTEPLATYTFARDLRTWTMLCDAMDENQDKMGKIPARLKKLLSQIRDLGGDSKKGVRGRLRDLAEVVDSGS